MTTDDDVMVAPGVSIPRHELEFRASRAGGAGGQHVNTSSTRIELLWNVRGTQALSDEARERVAAKLATRTDGDGWVRVVSSSRRSQTQNREAAVERLAELVAAALVVQKPRKATKPSRAAKQARLADKKKRGETKRQRRGEFD